MEASGLRVSERASVRRLTRGVKRLRLVRTRRLFSCTPSTRPEALRLVRPALENEDYDEQLEKGVTRSGGEEGKEEGREEEEKEKAEEEARGKR